jgi:hypothetical protein
MQFVIGYSIFPTGDIKTIGKFFPFAVLAFELRIRASHLLGEPLRQPFCVMVFLREGLVNYFSGAGFEP